MGIETLLSIPKDTVSRTRSSTALLASSKNSCGSMWLVCHRACQHTALECCFDLAKFHRSPYPVPTCTNRSHWYERYIIEFFKPSSLAIHVVTDCFLPIDNRRRLIQFCSSKFLWVRHVIVLILCTLLWYSVSRLLYQIVLYIIACVD